MKGDMPRLLVACRPEDALEAQRIVASLGFDDVLVDCHRRWMLADGHMTVGPFDGIAGLDVTTESLAAAVRSLSVKATA